MEHISFQPYVSYESKARQVADARILMVWKQMFPNSSCPLEVRVTLSVVLNKLPLEHASARHYLILYKPQH